MKYTHDLTGKTAVVTGAGGILCSDFAFLLAENGAEVALLDLNLEAAQKAADRITAAGGKAIAVKANVLEKDSLEEAKNQVLSAFGKVDILIEQAEKSVSVIIEDNGGGVPESELPMLFRRFHRTENASPDSAGIGLSITKAIV